MKRNLFFEHYNMMSSWLTPKNAKQFIEKKAGDMQSSRHKDIQANTLEFKVGAANYIDYVVLNAVVGRDKDLANKALCFITLWKNGELLFNKLSLKDPEARKAFAMSSAFTLENHSDLDSIEQDLSEQKITQDQIQNQFADRFTQWIVDNNIVAIRKFARSHIEEQGNISALNVESFRVKFGPQLLALTEKTWEKSHEERAELLELIKKLFDIRSF